MYADYRQPPPPPAYQDNYSLIYPHSNFQHYHPSMSSTGSSITTNDYGYEFNQSYYPPLQSTNSYGMLPSYNSTSNAFNPNFHASPYSTNFHAPPQYAYENLSTSPTIAFTKPEVEQENGASLGKLCPLDNSDRSESNFSSKLDVCAKSDDTLTELAESISNSDQNPIDIMYQSCNEEHISSKWLIYFDEICVIFNLFHGKWSQNQIHVSEWWSFHDTWTIKIVMCAFSFRILDELHPYHSLEHQGIYLQMFISIPAVEIC